MDGGRTKGAENKNPSLCWSHEGDSVITWSREEEGKRGNKTWYGLYSARQVKYQLWLCVRPERTSNTPPASAIYTFTTTSNLDGRSLLADVCNEQKSNQGFLRPRSRSDRSLGDFSM